MTTLPNTQQAEIRVVGVVQGIGFRPFIYAQATHRGLVGFVLNTGNSAVLIVVEGEKKKIIEFIESIEIDKPYLAVIDSIQTFWHTATGEFKEFQIRISKNEQKAGGSVIPADIAVCNDCIKDMNNSQSRHYQYPMTCCAICGPRYTTITDTPYDRERTTMNEFPLCEACDREYNNPLDRRYNAQTICCPICGPQFTLLRPDGTVLDVKDPFIESVKLLNEGAIVAVKGLGGIHLAVRATLDEQVQRLRKLRKKPNKPFAIMSKDLESIHKYAIIDSTAERLLLSWRRPIVVIPQRIPFLLSKFLSPGLDTVGVMLPYSGIYLRLFEGLQDPALVMTSANPTGLPTIIQASTFQEHFMDMADYFLTHNRTIFQRCDDSVVIPIFDRELIIRRSRGYTPEPIDTVNGGPSILSVGALEKNTGAIYHKRRIFLTQHIGDVDTVEALQFLQEGLSHLQNLLRVTTFDAVACDLHPDFLTTQYGAELSKTYQVPLIQVQHHHAHLAAILADHKLPLDEEIVAICCDGAGYGPDKTVWGGEILTGNAHNYTRSAYLEPQSMPGGDLAAKFPFRMLLGILSKKYSETELRRLFEIGAKKSLPRGVAEFEIILAQIYRDINTPVTSSTGRVLDSLAALLGVSTQRTYEGEPAIRLEAFANNGTYQPGIQLDIPVELKGKAQVLKISNLVDQILQLRDEFRGPDLALAAHQTLGKTLAQTAIGASKSNGLTKIGFSGGVAYNKILTRTIRRIIEAEGYEFLMHRNVPAGDAGTAVGQSLVARANLRKAS
ncbi:carbamoyltransferase HypF [Candidatus Bathyarchaeota archaeon]|nr:carbamoyltransferase HypF [Candidatus Bathyarchaeota archaeon]